MFRKPCISAAIAGVLALACVAVWTPLISSAGARNTTRTATTAQAVRRLRALHQLVLSRRTHRITSLPRIVGGSDAAQGDWPFMAFIVYFDESQNPVFSCSGTIVAPNVVLTAGHCTVDETTGATLDPTGYAVVTGSVDWSDTAETQVSPVTEVIPDPVYNATTDTNDAGLLVLANPTTAPAVKLATSADGYLGQAGTPALIAGWGETYNGDTTPQTYLQSADTVVQRAGYCHLRNRNFDRALELCTVDPPQDATGTCSGDSGGPLGADDASGQFVEIGLTTQAPVDCNTSTADYFAAIAPLNPWITSWIQAVAPPTPTATTNDDSLRATLNSFAPKIVKDESAIKKGLAGYPKGGVRPLTRALKHEVGDLLALGSQLSQESPSSPAGAQAKADIIQGLGLIALADSSLRQDILAVHGGRVPASQVTAAVGLDKQGRTYLLAGLKLLA
jgi:hypothetical protein